MIRKNIENEMKKLEKIEEEKEKKQREEKEKIFYPNQYLQNFLPYIPSLFQLIMLMQYMTIN